MKHHYLIIYIAITSLIILAGCTTSSSESSTLEPPPVPSPLVLTDITLAPSGGDASRYTEATVTIEGSTIVISNITNYFDTTRTETLRVSIADTDSPAAYTVEPEFIDIAANELNPDGTAAVTNILADHTFTLTPANGDAAITYTVSLRFSELEIVMLTPLSVEDITIDTSHPAYASASVLSVSDNIVSIGGIKNRTNGFNQDLTLTIADKTSPSAYTVAGGSTVTLAGTEINPAGTAAMTTATNEALTFTVTPTADNASPVKYYIVLVLGDLIQLELLSGTEGDLMNPLTLTEGITPPTATILVKNCGVFPPPYRVLVGGTPDTTTAYTLTATGINPYVSPPQTDTGNLTLTDGTTTLTFSPLSVTTSSCTAAGLSGTGTSSDPYIIDNDRKLNLVADLVNSNVAYRGSIYRVTRDIDLARPNAPWSAAQNGQFTPIGDTNADGVVFNGTFDCQGNVISNLYINTNGSYKGLFGVVTGMITNCGLVNANVTINASIMNTMTMTGEIIKIVDSTNIGSLVGFLNTSGTVTKSYSEQATIRITGIPSTDGAASIFLGGLVGANLGTISNSYSTGTVNNSGRINGGLVGLNNGTISQSYSRADVSGDEQIGGLVGNHGGSAMIENSYATGSVTPASRNAGGLVGLGLGAVVNSYAIGQVTGSGSGVNGLIGSVANSTITASYWDTDTSGRTGANDDAVGRTTAELQVAAPSTSVYTGWDTAIWNFRAGYYPRLKTVACANRQYAPAMTSACEDIP